MIDSISAKKPNNLAIQLDVFVDTDGMLRCGGRFKHANLSEATKFPILLPQSEKITNMLIEKEHAKLMHSGISQTLGEIRQRFWIPHGRASVTKVVKNCKVCTKVEGGPYKLPPMAPLPKSRVSESTSFTKTGLDYLGPLYIKENKQIPRN